MNTKGIVGVLDSTKAAEIIVNTTCSVCGKNLNHGTEVFTYVEGNCIQYDVKVDRCYCIRSGEIKLDTRTPKIVTYFKIAATIIVLLSAALIYHI